MTTDEAAALDAAWDECDPLVRMFVSELAVQLCRYCIREVTDCRCELRGDNRPDRGEGE